MLSFGQMVKEARRRERKKLREVAAASGLTISYISDIEHGRKNPPKIDAIKKIQKFLNIAGNALLKAAEMESSINSEIDQRIKTLMSKQPAFGVLSLLRATSDMPEEEFKMLIQNLEKKQEE